MSDLQCAARILLVRERPPRAVADGLRAERIAATYAGPADLDALADLHRGETVIVVGEHDLGPGPVVLVEVDADGRRVAPWDPPTS